MAKFEINHEGMRKFEAQLKKDVPAAMQQAADRTFAAVGGKAVSTVKSRLNSEMKKVGVDLDQRQLGEWAKLISEGTKINFGTK